MLSLAFERNTKPINDAVMGLRINIEASVVMGITVEDGKLASSGIGFRKCIF